MNKYLVVIFLCFGSQVFAVLPPLFQGKKEIEAIFSHPQFAESIPSGDVIQEITKTASGYLVITNKRILQVVIHYERARHVGPAQFSLEFKAPVQILENEFERKE